LIGSTRGDQHHASPARLNHHHPLAAAQRQAPHACGTGLCHRGADNSKGFGRDRAVGIDVIRRAEIDRVDVGTRHKGGQIDQSAVERRDL